MEGAYLYNNGRSAADDVGWYFTERTVVDAHDGQLQTQRQFIRQTVQFGVIVYVQIFKVLEIT